MEINYVRGHDGTFDTWDARARKLDRLVRPITAAYMLCLGAGGFLLLGWHNGAVEMTPHLAIATTALGIAGGLLLWGLRRISRDLRVN